ARQLGLPTAEDDDEALARPPRNKMEALGVKATADALENLIRDGRPEFKGDDGQLRVWAPHRPPRPEKSEGGVRFEIKSEYQPEAYVPRTDTYIEKDSSINEQIDRMRHSATRALLERDDVIIVASVSCIYGIGSVETYTAMTFALKKGERIDQRQLIADLVALQYKRTSADFSRGTFRVRG